MDWDGPLTELGRVWGVAGTGLRRGWNGAEKGLRRVRREANGVGLDKPDTKDTGSLGMGPFSKGSPLDLLVPP